MRNRCLDRQKPVLENTPKTWQWIVETADLNKHEAVLRQQTECSEDAWQGQQVSHRCKDFRETFFLKLTKIVAMAANTFFWLRRIFPGMQKWFFKRHWWPQTNDSTNCGDLFVKHWTTASTTTAATTIEASTTTTTTTAAASTTTFTVNRLDAAS